MPGSTFCPGSAPITFVTAGRPDWQLARALGRRVCSVAGAGIIVPFFKSELLAGQAWRIVEQAGLRAARSSLPFPDSAHFSASNRPSLVICPETSSQQGPFPGGVAPTKGQAPVG